MIDEIKISRLYNECVYHAEKHNLTLGTTNRDDCYEFEGFVIKKFDQLGKECNCWGPYSLRSVLAFFDGYVHGGIK